MLHEFPPPLILPHQVDAFDRLCEVGRAVIQTSRSDLPIKIRPSVFITGPSGSGKSHLARAVATAVGVPAFSLSISEWVLISATRRGSSATWPTICRFLASATANEGCVIFVDELDKLRGGGGEWTTFLLTEIFSLLDLRVPELLDTEDDDADSLLDHTRIQAEKILKTKTLLIGAGAFQELWTRQTPPIGFGSSFSPEVTAPDLNTLARHVPEELIRRFSSQIIALRPLLEPDYHDMLSTITPRLPERLRGRFAAMGRTRIPDAVRQCQGPRFFEELLLETIIAERREASNQPLVSKPQPSLKTLPGPAP